MQRTRTVMLAAMTGAVMMLGAGTASAHSVKTPGTCQFMGGPGNFGHPGHANGHTVALAAERSEAITIGGC